MQDAADQPLTIDQIAAKLKCCRGWVQLVVDAGCSLDEEGKVAMRDFMLFQLANIHKVREIAGLPPIATGASTEDLRPNVKAILTTQLEWLQFRSTKESVKRAAKLVRDKLETISVD